MIRESGADALPKFDDLILRLKKCGKSFPRHLQLNEINTYVHEENNQLPAFYTLHLLYHQCFCDLSRVALPGYSFPISTVIEKNQPERTKDLQLLCIDHACEITAILSASLRRKTRSLIDSTCAICAYEATKIQAVYARTCNGPEIDPAENIITNLTALDLIFSMDKKREALVYLQI